MSLGILYLETQHGPKVIARAVKIEYLPTKQNGKEVMEQQTVSVALLGFDML